MGGFPPLIALLSGPATSGALTPDNLPKGDRFAEGDGSLFAGTLRPLAELSGTLRRDVRFTHVAIVTFASDAFTVCLLPARAAAVTRVGPTVERRPAYTTPQFGVRHVSNVTVSRKRSAKGDRPRKRTLNATLTTE